MAFGQSMSSATVPVRPLVGDTVDPEPEDCSPRPRCHSFTGRGAFNSSSLWSRASRSNGGIRSFALAQKESFQGLARTGVPSAYRWEVWRAALGSSARDSPPGLYGQLFLEGSAGRWANEIEMDVHRTFGCRESFGDEHKQRLFRVLCAYASLNPEIGYCQGMNFVAGVVLLVAGAEEEEAFWLFVRLMEDGKLSAFYESGFLTLQRYTQCLDALIREREPELHEHLAAEDVQPAMYLHHWFLTLFADTLPLATVLAFWDVVICCGAESLIQLAASIVVELKHELLGRDLEGISDTFGRLREMQGPEQANFCRRVLGQSRDIEVPEQAARLLREGTPSRESLFGRFAGFKGLLTLDVGSMWGEASGVLHLPTLPSLPTLVSPRVSEREHVFSLPGYAYSESTRFQRTAACL